MSAAIISEVRKIRSTRLWWILMLIMVVTVATFAGFLAFAMVYGMEDAGGGEVDNEGIAISIYTMGVSLAYVFPLVLGALSVTSEFRHRTIDATLLLEPSRLRVIAAKFIAILPFALLYGLVSIATGMAVGMGAFAIADQPLMLDNEAVWESIGLGVVALATWALIGVGFGTALTNQVVVIVAVLGWTQFVEPLLRVGLSFFEPVSGVGAYLPGAAGEALVGSSFYSAAGGSDLLPPWAGLLVLLGYALVAAVIGWLTTFRRDIT
ncbi:ABC transporter permease [Demequina sp. SO4-13]|uniref:ABC transporter permease n=1 Tax=Demequina sp. SO4-13 TaxID=3401027 RepID=UPI003AF5D633